MNANKISPFVFSSMETKVGKSRKQSEHKFLETIY